jgi:hypothetical protein
MSMEHNDVLGANVAVDKLVLVRKAQRKQEIRGEGVG